MILLGTRRPAGGADIADDLFLGLTLHFLTKFFDCSLLLKIISNNFPLKNCNRTSFSSFPFDFSRLLTEFYFQTFVNKSSFVNHMTSVQLSYICLFLGRGTVVTGKLERGKLKKGDKVKAIGNGCDLASVVTGTCMYGVVT